MPKVEISVIVPVYNAEAYLHDTLESLSNQSFRDYEVILVDDGSTDGSSQIMDGYCREHEQFISIHQINGGEHEARMAGVRKARGQYIAFCDSDDLPLPKMLEKLYAQAKRTGADIVVCGFVREEMKSGRILSREMLAFEPRVYEFPELWDVLPVVNPALWNKLFRAELFQNPICFERPSRVAEDMLFFCSLCPYVRRMAFVPEALYRYRVRPGSAISRVSAADMELARTNMLLTRDYVLSKNNGKEMCGFLNEQAFIHFGLALVIRQVMGGEHSGIVVSSARCWLDRFFPGYRKAGNSLMWNLRHHMLQIKVLIGRWVFCAHLMGPFLLLYGFVTQKIKIEIKW